MTTDLSVEETSQEPQFQTTSVTIAGLNIELRVPDENQLAMYRRLQRRFALADRRQKQGEDLTAEAVADLLNNLFEIITSIVIDPDDSAFLESEVLASRLKLSDLMPVFTAGIEALRDVNQQHANRADRRAAGKTSKLVTDASI